MGAELHQNPEKIGRYEVIKKLGTGASGTVYLCNDSLYSRDVAIKVYACGKSEENSSDLNMMFETESAFVGKLSHPNILDIYDAGMDEGSPFLAMEYVHGARSLEAYCTKESLLPITTAVEIVYKCAKALNYAHSKGVIHRDVKPGNIMLTIDNDVRLIDFGIALVGDGVTPRIDGVVGTPSYLAPEQIRSQPVTHTSDLYSLGVVMYSLLTGRLPFRAKTVTQLLEHILSAKPIPIDMYRDGVPDELQKIVTRMMAHDVTERYSNGLEVALDLSRVHQMLASNGVDEADERVNELRRMPFFKNFSAKEIREVIKVGEWSTYRSGDIVEAGSASETRYSIILAGSVTVKSDGKVLYSLQQNGCFGGGTRTTKRRTTIATSNVKIFGVSAKLLEQTSTHCQLMFNKTFLNILIDRLEGPVAG